MPTKTEGHVTYNDFEPFCKWSHEEGSDILVVHILEFKREQLKVQINNLDTLKISGERDRPEDSTKVISRFSKEIRVPKDCNINGIQAKLIDNLLHIIMPKNSNLVTQKDQPKSSVPQPEPPYGGVAVEMAVSSMPGKKKMGDLFQLKTSVSTLKRLAKAAVAVALGAVLGGFVMYRFECSKLNLV